MLNSITLHQNFINIKGFQVVLKKKLSFDLCLIFSNSSNVFHQPKIQTVILCRIPQETILPTFVEFCAVVSNEQIFESSNIKNSNKKKHPKRAITPKWFNRLSPKEVIVDLIGLW